MINALTKAVTGMIEVRVATCTRDNAQRLMQSAFGLAAKDEAGKTVVAHAMLVGMCATLSLKKTRLQGAKASDTNQLIFSIADAEPYAAMAIAAMVATFEYQKYPMAEEVIDFELAWARYTLSKMEDEMRSAHLIGEKS